MGRRRGSRTELSPEVRREVMRLAARGASGREIAGRVSVFLGSVGNVLRPLRGVIRADTLDATGDRLGLGDRAEIRVGRGAGETLRSIAARLARAPRRSAGKSTPMVARPVPAGADPAGLAGGVLNDWWSKTISA